MQDDYSVKEIFDRKSGRLLRYYTHKRRPCRRVVLNSRLSAQMAGYALIQKDLETILAWVAALEELLPDLPKQPGDHVALRGDAKTYNLVKALFVSILTFYGKCFSKCEGRPVKLERAQLAPTYQALHDVCMRYRHNFAAHSGAEKIEYADVVVVFPVVMKKAVLPKLYFELLQPDLYFPSGDEVTFQQLLDHILTFVNQKIEKLNFKILSEEVCPLGHAYWASK